jgi:hypothetical protein
MGRPRSWNRRTCDDCLNIDVRKWSRSGGFLRPSLLRVEWTVGGRAAGCIRVRTDRDSVILSYRMGSHGDYMKPVQQRIPIEWTDCRHGGRRPWFLCASAPGKRSCSCRVAKLYLSGQGFACRQCHGLTYASQRENPWDRAMRRAQKLRLKLGESTSLLEPFPARPKGMHRVTYWRLSRRAQDADGRAWLSMERAYEPFAVGPLAQ